MFELLLQTLMVSPLLIAGVTGSKQAEWKRLGLMQQAFSDVRETVEVVLYTLNTEKEEGE